MPALKESKKIDVQQATAAAAKYFQALYPDIKSYSLEEVELSEDENYWLITLSFEWGAKLGALGILQPPKTQFKVFKVDVKTGAVISMKIRKLE